MNPIFEWQPQNHQFRAQVVGLMIRAIFLVSSIVQSNLVLIQRRLEPGFSHIEIRGEIINQVVFDNEKSQIYYNTLTYFFKMV